MAVQTITDMYELDDSTNQVHLDVKIGYAQPAASRLFIDSSAFGGQKTDDFDTDIGSNASLKKKKLVINTSVWDIQAATNQTSVTVKITGGKKSYERTVECSVGEQGGVAIYLTTIYFF